MDGDEITVDDDDGADFKINFDDLRDGINYDDDEEYVGGIDYYENGINGDDDNGIDDNEDGLNNDDDDDDGLDVPLPQLPCLPVQSPQCATCHKICMIWTSKITAIPSKYFTITEIFISLCCPLVQ